MVIDALATSVLGWSGPAIRGTRPARNSTVPYAIQRVTAGRLVIGTFGSRGGRAMIAGSAGSRRNTTTGKIATKKFRNSTMSGVIATPLLMLNTVAVTNSSTSESSWVIW